MNVTNPDQRAVIVDLQQVSQLRDIPSSEQFDHWATAALSGYKKPAELTIRIVDEEESRELNERYRKRKGPTNVLSFSFEAPEGVELDLLGDLVICAPVVRKEAVEQSKEEWAHWAHMIVHGVLHLLGFDHIEARDAEIMENREIGILKELEINNPYEE